MFRRFYYSMFVFSTLVPSHFSTFLPSTKVEVTEVFSIFSSMQQFLRVNANWFQFLLDDSLDQGGKSWFWTTRMANNVSVVFFSSLPLNVNQGPLCLIFSPWLGNRQTLNLSEWMGMDANAEQLFPPWLRCYSSKIYSQWLFTIKHSKDKLKIKIRPKLMKHHLTQKLPDCFMNK